MTALFTSRPELKARGIAGPALPSGECGLELSEGGQALPNLSDGFWPQQALVVMGNKGVEEGKAAPLDNGGETDGKP